MKKFILTLLSASTLLASCSENKVYNVHSHIYGNEVVISSEKLVKGDTVRIGFDIAGREIASKDMHGQYIGHIAIVD